MRELIVNGERRTVRAEPGSKLLFVLRNELGLTAAKPGCLLGQCGSCTVLVDGQARNSCTLPIGELADAQIVTLEGIGTQAEPHALQRAFIAENAAQCGYCTAGILLTAKALLDRNRAPGEREIKRALKDNLCRCGSHNRVLRAVQRAARELAGAR
jgi:nicotinate dehydrogenase subunit A